MSVEREERNVVAFARENYSKEVEATSHERLKGRNAETKVRIKNFSISSLPS
jgi:hypothetical protein